jgi:hypothetical protein
LGSVFALATRLAMIQATGLALLVLGVALLRPANSQGYVELSAMYLSDTLNPGTTTTSTTRMYIDGSIGFMIDKRGQYLAGWGYSMHSTSNGADNTTTYSSTQMGPRFLIYLDRDLTYVLGLAYLLVSSASYSDGAGTDETWKGTVIRADFGYAFAISPTLQLIGRFNYSMASYVEKLVGGTTYSTDASKQTAMYPSIALNWIW